AGVLAVRLCFSLYKA
ncbi:MAG: photosystem I reaction center subunit XII, partial [Cyanobacteriota bacterium]